MSDGCMLPPNWRSLPPKNYENHKDLMTYVINKELLLLTGGITLESHLVFGMMTQNQTIHETVLQNNNNAQEKQQLGKTHHLQWCSVTGYILCRVNLTPNHLADDLWDLSQENLKTNVQMPKQKPTGVQILSVQLTYAPQLEIINS
jgi:hypothetical protein